VSPATPVVEAGPVRVRVTVQRDLHLAAHRRNRRTQLMAHVPDDTPLHAQGALQPCQHGVEHLDE